MYSFPFSENFSKLNITLHPPKTPLQIKLSFNIYKYMGLLSPGGGGLAKNNFVQKGNELKS